MELQFRMLETQARDAFACMEEASVDSRQKGNKPRAFGIAAFENLISAAKTKWNDTRNGETA